MIRALRLLALLAGASLTLTACYASRAYNEPPAGESSALRIEKITSLPVVVQEPVIPSPEEKPHWTMREAREMTERRAAANRLRALLKASGMIEQVGQTRDFPGQRTIVLRAIPAPPIEGAHDDTTLLWFVFDLLIPYWTTTNDGLFFQRIDANALEFRCDWRVTEVRSLFLALPLLPLPSWTSRTHYLRELEIPIENVRRCLVEQSAVFATEGSE